MIRIDIERPAKAFLPESEAYLRYFRKDKRFDVEINDPNNPDQELADVELRYFGLVPRWRRRASILVGDYNSMSTGNFPRLKDTMKKVINTKPDIALALNHEVIRHLGFQLEDVIPRPMGYFGDLVKERKAPKWDLVYSGSISRPTVLANLNRLAQIGLRIVVVGASSPNGASSRLEFVGPQPIETVYDIYSQSRFGLNITPNIFPYFFQDSTKVIEYSACGLGVVTNKYQWVDNFAENRGGQFLDITKLLSASTLDNFDFQVPEVSDLEWQSVMHRTDLANRIAALAAGSRKE